MLWRLATTNNVRDFEALFHAMPERSRTYVETIERKFWADIEFMGRRFGHYTSNLVESLNSVLLPARSEPVCGMIETILKKMREWWLVRREDAKSMSGLLTTTADDNYERTYAKAAYLDVIVIEEEEEEFQVREENKLFDLKMLDQYCSCKKWQMELFPCIHAMAVFRYLGTRGKEFVDDVYSVNYYKEATLIRFML
ncbi:hypothetical protein RCL1_005769 [Eukaryota sp. TZLM3-RCL]